MMRYLLRAGAFLYDFLVGDAWELFIGPLAGVLLAAGLIQLGVDAALAGVVLVAMVVVIIAVHLALALRAAT